MHDAEIKRLYATLLDAWNRRDASAMAWVFAEDGSIVGFDGSQENGRANIEAHVGPIFANHPTPAYVSVVREVRVLGNDTALLRAVVGMIPSGKSDINPALNAVQTLVAVRRDGRWQAAMFQNTPAALHGRPGDAEKLTAELRAAIKR